MLKDPWKIGEEQLRGNDVLYSQAERVRHLKKGVAHLEMHSQWNYRLNSRVSTVVVGREMQAKNNWQQFTCGRVNNLGLK